MVHDFNSNKLLQIFIFVFTNFKEITKHHQLNDVKLNFGKLLNFKDCEFEDQKWAMLSVALLKELVIPTFFLLWAALSIKFTAGHLHGLSRSVFTRMNSLWL